MSATCVFNAKNGIGLKVLQSPLLTSYLKYVNTGAAVVVVVVVGGAVVVVVVVGHPVNPVAVIGIKLPAG